jgi:hypothetical protein
MSWDGEERRKQPTTGQRDILERLDQMDEKLAKVCHFIEGNGKPERGAVVRLDRLEQSKTLMAWMMGVVWVSVIGIIVKGIAEAMSR